MIGQYSEWRGPPLCVPTRGIHIHDGVTLDLAGYQLPLTPNLQMAIQVLRQEIARNGIRARN